MEYEGSARNGLYITHKIKVSTYDIDYANHVSNIAYLRWLEDMRLVLFDKYFSLQRFMSNNRCPVLASTSIQYKRPIKLFDQPEAHMWISNMGKTSMTIKAELKVAETITTTVEHVIVFIDMATGKPIRLPAECKEIFEKANQ